MRGHRVDGSGCRCRLRDEILEQVRDEGLRLVLLLPLLPCLLPLMLLLLLRNLLLLLHHLLMRLRLLPQEGVELHLYLRRLLGELVQITTCRSNPRRRLVLGGEDNASFDGGGGEACGGEVHRGSGLVTTGERCCWFCARSDCLAISLRQAMHSSYQKISWRSG